MFIDLLVPLTAGNRQVNRHTCTNSTEKVVQIRHVDFWQFVISYVRFYVVTVAKIDAAEADIL